MQLTFLSFRASTRVVTAVAVLVVIPAMALAPAAHALQSLPVIPSVPDLREAARAAIVTATGAETKADPAELVQQCDQEATRSAGARACRAAAFAYFTDKGLSPDVAAGVVGNLWLESSGVSPKSRQFGGGPGRGIAQWTVDQRWQGVVGLAEARGVDPYTLHVQLDYLWHELRTTYKVALAAMKSAANIHETTLAFQNKFEVPIGTWIGGPAYAFNTHPSAHTAERIAYAEAVKRRWSD